MRAARVLDPVERKQSRAHAQSAAEELARALALQLPIGSMIGPIPTPQELAAFLLYDITPEVEPSLGFTYPPEVDRG